MIFFILQLHWDHEKKWILLHECAIKWIIRLWLVFCFELEELIMWKLKLNIYGFEWEWYDMIVGFCICSTDTSEKSVLVSETDTTFAITFSLFNFSNYYWYRHVSVGVVFQVSVLCRFVCIWVYYGENWFYKIEFS